MKVQRGFCYSYTLSLTSALEGVDDQRQPQPLYPPTKETRYPYSRRFGVPGAVLDEFRKSRPHRGSNPVPPTCNLVAMPTTLSRPYLW